MNVCTLSAEGAEHGSNLGEKPLVTLNGRPMIGLIIEAFHDAGHEVVVVLTERLRTLWLVQGSDHPLSRHLRSPGISNLAEAAAYLGYPGSFLFLCWQSPLHQPGNHLRDQGTLPEILERPARYGCPGCSGKQAPPFVFRQHWHNSCMSRRHQHTPGISWRNPRMGAWLPPLG